MKLKKLLLTHLWVHLVKELNPSDDNEKANEEKTYEEKQEDLRRWFEAQQDCV